ncbi:peptidase domain-containing ABC transporter [Ferrimonas sediminicola]|uniref:Peptidase domain-containing ABC transporter n=1 Tax=Ferrimonas sediminicola TaxID=2569538 RepID=A0A4U1BIJ7_9GAMM|nr:peptidase domain-containing ABC transporter [Ferrimonas sediminicola]TKB51179.1 peptidase domain-containing ABC transporter [Ferrimonas sediminicola]
MQFSGDKNQGVLDFSGIRRVPVILQAEIAECGLACLAMIVGYFGRQVDLATMRKKFSANLKGMNLQEMAEVADTLGVATRALKCSLEEVHKLKLPCIVHWNMNHFVVLTKVSKENLIVIDPANGRKQYSKREFSSHFTGIALEFTPTSAFKRKDERKKMKLSQLWSKSVGFKRSLVSLFALSFMIQILSLVSPYYIQWVVDEVLLSKDLALLKVLAMGFALVVLINTVVSAVRSWLVVRLSSQFNFHLGINLLRHLLKLPMSFFEARHVGDLISRFGSLAQIRERLTTGLVETAVDGVMSLTVLVVMLIYDVRLTAIVLAAISLYAALRLGLYRALHRATEDSIQASAREQSTFIESIRVIQTIKLFNRESQRQSLWLNQYTEVINADIRLGKLNISFESANRLLFGMENVVVVYISSLLVMGGALTVGMVLAFLAYKAQLMQRASSFLEQLIIFRMLRLHLDRLADIALEKEEEFQESTARLESVAGCLSLSGLSFSYTSSKFMLFDNLSLNIKAGEHIAIVGPSGSGKSTLMKLMLGLMRPTSGKILIDGVDITALGSKCYRSHIAAVMQEDTLLSGTVADNITLFDPEPNLLWMQKCAQIASIDNEVQQLSMGYNSLVGDMGNQFSGGQVQRLLLARALYKKPKVLFLDEATSHLDLANEARICGQLGKLTITRIVIAHRPETVKSAERVFKLESGRITEVSIDQIQDEQQQI